MQVVCSPVTVGQRPFVIRPQRLVNTSTAHPSANACCGFVSLPATMKAMLNRIVGNHFSRNLAGLSAPRPLPALVSCQWSRTFADVSTTVGPDLAAVRPPTFTRPRIITEADGRQMIAFDMRPHPKLKPKLVASRVKKLRTYVGQEKDIRHSPWRLNLVCQLAAGLPLSEALTQLEFCKKGKAPLVQRVLKRTSNLADIRHGLQISQLEVAECFATKGTPLKRMKIMGRGRTGRKERKHSHMRVVLREIDFPLKIYQARTLAQKRRWYLMQMKAEQDSARAAAEREEIERLEREAEAFAAAS